MKAYYRRLDYYLAGISGENFFVGAVIYPPHELLLNARHLVGLLLVNAQHKVLHESFQYEELSNSIIEAIETVKMSKFKPN